MKYNGEITTDGVADTGREVSSAVDPAAGNRFGAGTDIDAGVKDVAELIVATLREAGIPEGLEAGANAVIELSVELVSIDSDADEGDIPTAPECLEDCSVATG